MKSQIKLKAVLGDDTDFFFFYYFAPTSPPHASFSLCHSLSCADDVKRHSDIQQWRLKE